MKFTCTVDINAPIDYVSGIFENPANLKHFQDGFISKETISGTPSSNGTISKMKYKKLELIETIITNNLPDEFIALYEHKHMTNTMKVNFVQLADKRTRYSSEIEYTKFNGFFIKTLAKLFPSLFKKQVQKWLNQFKNYTESQYANNQTL